MEEERGERSWMAWETRRIGVISLRRGGGADGRRGPEVRWEAYLRMRSSTSTGMEGRGGEEGIVELEVEIEELWGRVRETRREGSKGVCKGREER